MWGARVGGTAAPRPRRVRTARLLWTLFSIVLWSVIFDVHVQLAAIRYVTAQQRYEFGHAPRTSIAAVMDPAVSAGVRHATLWSGLVALAGLGAIARSARPRADDHA